MTRLGCPSRTRGTHPLEDVLLTAFRRYFWGVVESFARLLVAGRLLCDGGLLFQLAASRDPWFSSSYDV